MLNRTVGSNAGPRAGTGRIKIAAMALPVVALPAVALLAGMSAAMSAAAGDDRGQGAGPQAGEILWSLQTGRSTFEQFISVGQAGIIYTSDFTGLRAVNPGGTQLWFIPDLGGSRPIAIAADGALIVAHTLNSGSPNAITALEPDGSLRWTFTSPDPNEIKVGPSIGPDGNIYAVQETTSDGDDGLGIFSLTPEGTLRWSTIGEPALWTLDSTTNSSIVFADDRLYMGLPFLASGPPVPRSFTLDDGDQLWINLDDNMRSYPRVDPFGRPVGARGQTAMQAFTPEGEVDWATFHPGNPNVILRPTIGTGGTVYGGDYIGVELWALNAAGETIWSIPNNGTMLSKLTVSPDDELLLAAGTDSFVTPGWLRGHDADDGSLLWETVFPNEGGVLSYVSSYDAAFSPDGSTAYVTVQFTGSAVQHGHLVAIATGTPGTPRPPAPIPGDCNADGAVNGADLGILLSAWGICASCPADINADGTVDGADLGLLLSAWTD